MSAPHDLAVDTWYIRRSAATLDTLAGRLTGAAPGSGPGLAAGALGHDATSSAVARLVDLRCRQAKEAAGQLGDIAAGTADQLRLSADAFDRLEAGPRGPR